MNQLASGSGSVSNGIGSPTVVDQTDSTWETLNTPRKKLKLLSPFSANGNWYVEFTYVKSATATATGRGAQASADAYGASLTPDGRQLEMGIAGSYPNYHSGPSSDQPLSKPSFGNPSQPLTWTAPMRVPVQTERLTLNSLTWKDVLHIGFSMGDATFNRDTETETISGAYTSMDVTGIALAGGAVSLALSAQLASGAGTTGNFTSNQFAALQTSGTYLAPLKVDVMGQKTILFSPYTYISKRDTTKGETWSIKADWSDGVSGDAEADVIIHLPAEEAWRGAVKNDSNYRTSGNRVTAVQSGKQVQFNYPGGTWAPPNETSYNGQTSKAPPYVEYAEPAMSFVGELASGSTGDNIIASAAVTAILEYLSKSAATTLGYADEVRNVNRDSTILEMWPNLSPNDPAPGRAGRLWRVDVIRTTQYQPIAMDRWDYHGFVGRGIEWDVRDTPAASSVPVFIGGAEAFTGL